MAIFEKTKEQEQVIDQEHIRQEADPLRITIKDEDLVKIINKRIEDTRKYYTTEYNLYKVREKNELYRFGRQVSELEDKGKMKDYESRSLDNVLYEIEATIKPLAMSQLPDLIVTPGNQSQQSQDSARLLTKAVDTQVKARENRKVLAQASQHRPVYRVGVVKARWNPELAGGLGDYEFVCIHPDNIDVDYTATESDVDKMQFIAQLVPITVQEVIMRFPKAKAEFMDQLKKDGLVAKSDSEPSWKAMATSIKMREVWFKEYQKTDDDKYEMVSGVCWKYKDVILAKMKNPNFDYEGSKQVVTYDNLGLESSKRALSDEEMQQGLATGQYPLIVQQQDVYHNYFANPRVPFFLMVYDQWGKQPFDETTSFEQNINNQTTLDKRRKQIDDTLNNRGHHVWSKESGLKPADIEKMDHNNPDEDYVVDGNVNAVHKFIEPERPGAEEFGDTNTLRDRMFSLAGANAVRGNIQSEVATTNQIAREANYTRADDLVDDTINPAAEWMAQWALQFIKLRYTQEHYRWLFGSKGETLYAKLHQNMVDDGMEVMIKASGTDKLKAQNNAQEMARMEMTDPLSFFQDMGMDDAEGRTLKLLMFKANPAMYAQEFMKDNDAMTPDLIEKLNTMAPPPAPIPAQGMPQPGMPPVVPGMPDPNAQNVPPGQVQVPSPLNPIAQAPQPNIIPQGAMQ